MILEKDLQHHPAWNRPSRLHLDALFLSLILHQTIHYDRNIHTWFSAPAC